MERKKRFNLRKYHINNQSTACSKSTINNRNTLKHPYRILCRTYSREHVYLLNNSCQLFAIMDQVEIKCQFKHNCIGRLSSRTIYTYKQNISVKKESTVSYSMAKTTNIRIISNSTLNCCAISDRLFFLSCTRFHRSSTAIIPLGLATVTLLRLVAESLRFFSDSEMFI